MTPTLTGDAEVTIDGQTFASTSVSADTDAITMSTGTYEFVIYVTKNPHASQPEWCRHSVHEFNKAEAVAKVLEICRFSTGPANEGEAIDIEVFVHPGTHMKFEHRLVEL